jgi:RNA polymerase-binding protein DksA
MAAKQATASATVVRKPKVLTEEDLLKAPEKDYMNEAQLAFFRQRLTELRDQLLQNADDTGEHLRENEITTDPSDRATLEEEYTLELRTRDRERKLLKKVEQANRRWKLRLLRGDRRAHRNPAAACAPHGNAVTRSSGAPRARPEALRRLSEAGERQRAKARRARRRAMDAGRWSDCCTSPSVVEAGD